MAGLADYTGRTALISGASSGIGAELARQVARRGARVALVARRRERLDQLSREISGAGGQSSIHVCDVANRTEVEATHRAVQEKWGGVDLLINNAGSNHHALFKDLDVGEIERMTQTNYLGPVYWMKSVLPSMQERGRGWIINMSSLAGLIPQPDEAAYSATKFAVAGLSEGLSYELEPLGIHVMTVYPALVRTEMFTPEVLARMPAGAERSFVEPPEFCRQVLHALARGRFEVTVPRYVGIAYAVRALLPGFHRRMTKRIRLPKLPDLTT